MARYAWLAVMMVGLGAAALAIAAAPPQAEHPAGTEEAAQEVGPKVEVVGLEIMKAPPSEFNHASVVSRLEGTTITFRAETPDKQFVVLDEVVTKVTTWADDKGTNLAEKIDDEWYRVSWTVSHDRQMALFEIRSDAVPAPGAREMSLEAIVGIKCGSEGKTVEQKDFALQVGSELTVGPAPMKVKTIGEGGGDDGMEVTLKSTTNPEAIKGLVFLSADGKAINAYIAESSYSGSPGQMTYTRTYALAEKVDVVTVRITYFTQVETLTVPVNLKIGIGF